MKQNIYKMNLNKFLEKHKGDLSGKYFLLDFRQEWCYEFDARGFCAATGEELSEYVSAARDVRFIVWGEEFWYFGTNQSLGYWSLEDFFDHFTVTEISMEEYSLLKRFGDIWNGYGQFPDMNVFHWWWW